MVELPLPIETSRLRLRSFVTEDLHALHAIQSREDIHRWLNSEPHRADEVRETIERRIARVRNAPETGVTLAVVLAATDELLGDVSLTLGAPEHRQAEIGFTFHPAHHGRGYATEAWSRTSGSRASGRASSSTRSWTASGAPTGDLSRTAVPVRRTSVRRDGRRAGKEGTWPTSCSCTRVGACPRPRRRRPRSCRPGTPGSGRSVVH
ncbi:MAG: GNAT family N-acetyltransferase [Actinomycetota bacterium]